MVGRFSVVFRGPFRRSVVSPVKVSCRKPPTPSVSREAVVWRSTTVILVSVGGGSVVPSAKVVAGPACPWGPLCRSPSFGWSSWMNRDPTTLKIHTKRNKQPDYAVNKDRILVFDTLQTNKIELLLNSKGQICNNRSLQTRFATLYVKIKINNGITKVMGCRKRFELYKLWFL